MEQILLHVCCGPCATHTIDVLKRETFEITLFFSNSNIQPAEEYRNRLASLITYTDRLNIPLVVDSYNPAEWFELVKGYEECPEGGERCKICIEARLKRTAKYAKDHGFTGFTTTLTISPHKSSKIINEIGTKLAKEFEINFLQENFKKQNGFKKSVAISKQFQLYRQNYCGCIFSIKKT
ncbi:MAG: epoxyqueuosine reductase QueH [Candidatus Helarchaeota archaeon]